MIQNPELSLAGGAIRGWDRRNFYYFQMLKSLADHYKFDVEAPWGSLSANVHKVVLYGSGKENIEFKYMNDRGDTSIRRHPFEGVLHNIGDRLKFLVNVGLNYLTLSRSAETLSGGEAQRIRLASQIGAGLVGVMYVLDEPSIGLHQRDNERLLGTLIHLRDLGNTVIVVEHDEDAIRAADHVIDIGPGAGVHGGEVVAEGPLEAIMAVNARLRCRRNAFRQIRKKC